MKRPCGVLYILCSMSYISWCKFLCNTLSISNYLSYFILHLNFNLFKLIAENCNAVVGCNKLEARKKYKMLFTCSCSLLEQERESFNEWIEVDCTLHNEGFERNLDFCFKCKACAKFTFLFNFGFSLNLYQ